MAGWPSAVADTLRPTRLDGTYSGRSASCAGRSAGGNNSGWV
jgi:hypothetical protein